MEILKQNYNIRIKNTYIHWRGLSTERSVLEKDDIWRDLYGLCPDESPAANPDGSGSRGPRAPCLTRAQAADAAEAGSSGKSPPEGTGKRRPKLMKSNLFLHGAQTRVGPVPRSARLGSPRCAKRQR